MKQQLLFYCLIGLFFLPLSGCKEKAAIGQSLNRLEIITTDGVKHPFNVEIALTPQEQAQGLMHRTEMADNAAMLFYFPEEAERGFWMKNTLIPLDILFIKSDGTIHHIHENAIPQDLTTIWSNGPVRAVLEINGGISKKLGLKVGNKINHRFFNNNSVQ